MGSARRRGRRGRRVDGRELPRHHADGATRARARRRVDPRARGGRRRARDERRGATRRTCRGCRSVTAASTGSLQSAGLLFFAFAGYARIATLGEEVRDPAGTIPRAIPVALGITVAIYAAVGVSMLLAARAGRARRRAARRSSPRSTRAGAAWASPVARVGAAVASLGALLALIAGVGRTTLAMARERRPAALARVRASGSPRARSCGARRSASSSSALVLTTDLRGAIGFSSFGVLVYYAIANASAFTQTAQHRRWPRALNVGRPRRVPRAHGNASVARGGRGRSSDRCRPRRAVRQRQISRNVICCAPSQRVSLPSSFSCSAPSTSVAKWFAHRWPAFEANEQ